MFVPGISWFTSTNKNLWCFHSQVRQETREAARKCLGWRNPCLWRDIILLYGSFKFQMFLFSPLAGEMIQQSYIFRMGWNHQLVWNRMVSLVCHSSLRYFGVDKRSSGRRTIWETCWECRSIMWFGSAAHQPVFKRDDHGNNLTIA